MARTRRGASRRLVVAAAATLLALPWAAVLLRVGARAQSTGATTAGGTAVQSQSAPAWSPFSLAPADPGAIPYADLVEGPVPDLRPGHPDDPIPTDIYRQMSRETRASVDQAEEWAQVDNGPAAAAAWSTYTSIQVAGAERRRAEYESGLAGIGDTGVP